MSVFQFLCFPHIFETYLLNVFIFLLLIYVFDMKIPVNNLGE